MLAFTEYIFIEDLGTVLGPWDTSVLTTGIVLCLTRLAFQYGRWIKNYKHNHK